MIVAETYFRRPYRGRLERLMNLTQLARLQKLKSQLDTFHRNHPKFAPFLDAVNKNALGEGTIIEISVTSPEGRHYETNLKVNQEDLEFLRSLQGLNSTK